MRDAHRRLIKLEEMDYVGMRVKAVISDEPDGCAVPIVGHYAVSDRVLTAEEWEREHCNKEIRQ